jgi:hypothetical protein
VSPIVVGSVRLLAVPAKYIHEDGAGENFPYQVEVRIFSRKDETKKVGTSPKFQAT